MNGIQTVTLEEFGHGDHPPNEFSVVDEHLPEKPVCGKWVTNHDRTISEKVESRLNFSNTNFVNLTYKVGSWNVFVVWPKKYAANPPGPNRLGWLPQMEFGEAPGLTNIKKDFTPGTVTKFSYTAINGEKVDLEFTA